MQGKFILISGSASYTCPQDRLNTAIEFICSFTHAVLRGGGGFVVLASDEDSTKDQYATPHVFDWVVLRQVEKYAETTAEHPRIYVHLVMSDEATEGKIDDANLMLLKNLEQRNVVELHRIRRERFTGGEYRRVQARCADAMLGIGGGKGTYAIGKEMMELGKPVLPLSLGLGSLSDDGKGSVALYREMLASPNHFFPNTYRDVINRTELMALSKGINQAGAVAQVAVEVIDGEFNFVPRASRLTAVKKRLAVAWQVARALPVVSAIIKIVEAILRSVG